MHAEPFQARAMTAPALTAMDIAAIKTATRALVRSVGGIEAAAMVCRYGKSAIAEGYDPHRPDRTLPVDVLADLERCAAEPFVTAVLARLAGYVLTPIAASAMPETQAVADVGSTSSAAFAEFAAGMADGRLSGAERAALADRLVAVNEASARAVAALLAHREDPA
jgi:hypothetical protein